MFRDVGYTLKSFRSPQNFVLSWFSFSVITSFPRSQGIDLLPKFTGPPLNSSEENERLSAKTLSKTKLHLKRTKKLSIFLSFHFDLLLKASEQIFKFKCNKPEAFVI